MNLPKVVADLVKAQDNFDCVAYADCFSETGLVFDENKTYNGRKKIQHWIAEANNRYKTRMKPLSFEDKETESILKAEISGDFEGSPVVLTYTLKLHNGLIQSLKIRE
ncbi:nuclear transport factor 2 family protein [Sphingobacterium shayense]|uniref:nuclear transport factor 2 family protein n=1 Tax=Sphingobacterium shayense TaxID=626343 RepID=UPI001554D05A|nr:nuclear transport factor 2 family protein [Sphingobacterium shayense]NQD69806.1 nuclear transport factor 2 family protein [Sphingobacterium shayense]